MRTSSLLLPFALLPLLAVAHDDHASLAPHEHGVATLNLALEGNTLEIELESPAMNLVGFEHPATSEADKATLAAARAQLERPLELFGIPAAAGCSVSSLAVKSPLFGDANHDHDHDHDHAASGEHHEHVHSDIDADYSLACTHPGALGQVDLGAFFKRFPATHTLRAQVIGPKGQQGVSLTPAEATLQF